MRIKSADDLKFVLLLILGSMGKTAGRMGGDEAAEKDGKGRSPDVVDPENMERVQTGVKTGKEDQSRKKTGVLRQFGGTFEGVKCPARAVRKIRGRFVQSVAESGTEHAMQCVSVNGS